MIHKANQMAVFEIIQEVNDLLNFFMIKQPIPHFGAWLGLINNNSSNHCGQPMIGTTLIFDWRIDIR
jgi:hypothetical protein